MGVDVAALKRLSTLLGEALDLDERGRESWLAALDGDDASFAPKLRELLARHASAATDLFAPPAWIERASAAAPGDTVGAYRLLREIGAGGMSAVWLAERVDGQLARKVALKLPHIGWSPAIAERFAREREILASLEHPNIARLYDVGTDAQGRPYMALEFVEGEPIDAHCRRHALSVAERLVLLLQAADAVAFAHSRLVIHRDLKPANILVTVEGEVRLLDFGIAKLMEGDSVHETALTRASGRGGSRAKAKPPQIRGAPLGPAGAL
jgi:serine/threonine protein kinase